MKLFPSSNLEFLQISYFSQIHVESVKWRLCVTFTKTAIKSVHFAEMLPKLVGSLKKGVLKYECCRRGVCAFIFRFIHVLEKCGSRPPPPLIRNASKKD